MFCLHVRCHIHPEKLAEFQKIALSLMEKTRSEPGCLSYEIGEEEPGVVAWIERWENEEALTFHKSAPYFLESEAAIDSFFTKPAEAYRLVPFLE